MVIRRGVRVTGAEQRAVGDPRRSACRRGAHVGGRGAARRPGGRRDGQAVPRRCGLLTALGAREPHSEAEDRGFVYYTRYFTGRACQRGPALVPLGTISLVTISATMAPGRSRSSGHQDAPPRRCATPRSLPGWSGRARCRPTGWMASRSRRAADGRLMDRYCRFVVDGARSRPDSPRSGTHGPAPTPRPAVGSASGSCTPSCSGGSPETIWRPGKLCAGLG